MENIKLVCIDYHQLKRLIRVIYEFIILTIKRDADSSEYKTICGELQLEK